ncbi:DUF3015 family protein [Immundisolibacter sp.]|uniref:DUF3015 family protein n=1 Tax=Immundisolibacter sp. TaxID=1934948 RepID=UPI003566DAB0
MRIREFMLNASIVVAAMSASTAVFAETKAAGSGPNPYADCGIGAALFNETKWAAVTSNVIWDLGITAITSATSSPETCSGKKLVAALFIRDTYANLVEETAAGQGEHLTTALNIFGCGESRQAVATQAIRGAMGHAVSAPDYSDLPHLDKAANFYSIIENSVNNSCSA